MISGTSRDGVDAALVSFEGDTPAVLAACCEPYPPPLRARLDDLLIPARRPTPRAAFELDAPLADHFAATARRLLDAAGVDPARVTAIGSHGQTVWHDPDRAPPETLQLGDPQRIADVTGITTVGDFRRADVEAGGQGAPLAPLLHRALFALPGTVRAVLNLGGIANVSLLDAAGRVTGFDTGPANCLMDAWIGRHRGAAFDRDGAWAASAAPDPDLLERLLADPWFERPPPKSTGLEYFNLGWLERRVTGLAGRDPAVVQATLCELTAASVAAALDGSGADDMLVCGGGAHNRHLLGRLQARLGGVTVRSTAAAGLDPDWIEAILFAWLARERLAGRALDTPPVTGAARPVLLGRIAHPV
jgi:anhydro-N-acetylmuramic acid kinase